MFLQVEFKLFSELTVENLFTKFFK
jgi:hypothetical protein